MLTIGKLRITSDGEWPKSRVILKRRLRSFARELGLELNFVIRKKMTMSYCQLSMSKATVCEGLEGKPWPMASIMFYGLHEIAHWIQYNEGMFPKYFGKPYYDQWIPPTTKEALRLGLRVERHANWLARKLAQELFGCWIVHGSIYDDSEAARAFLERNYTYK